jgi:hypothetical protein
MEMIIKNNIHCFHHSNVVKGNLINMRDHFWQQNIITNSCSLNPCMHILIFSPSFIEFKIIVDCTGFVGLGQSPLPRFNVTQTILCFATYVCRFSLVNFMYIVLQIFYPLLFPSIKRVIFIHNKLIIILTYSYFTCPSIWMAVDWKGFQSLLEMIE